MINPINISTNPICYQKTPVNQTSNPQVLQQDNFELSNYKSAQAILVRNNISFKNLVMPIEITDKYNKKSEGMEHLDLPNIHVFEYPDTNLQVIMNVDKSISTKDDTFLEQPQIIFQILENTPIKNQDLLKNKLIKDIIKTKIQNKTEISINDFIVDDKTFYSYCEAYGINTIDNLKNLNEIMFNLKISEKDLANAKNNILSVSDKDNINTVSLNDLQNYYDYLKTNFAAQVFVTVSEDYFEKNNNKLFKELNNLNVKLCKNNQQNIEGIKTDILKIFTMSILNSYKNFNKNFYVIRHDDNKGSVNYRVLYKNDFNESEYNHVITEILQENMQEILKQNKKMYLLEIEKILSSSDYLPIIKNITLQKIGNNFIDFQRVVNTIEEKDIKNNITTNFLKRKPLIGRYKDLSYEGYRGK